MNTNKLRPQTTIDPDVEAACLADAFDETITDAELSGVIAQKTGDPMPVLVRVSGHGWTALIIGEAIPGRYADLPSPCATCHFVSLPHRCDSFQRATQVYYRGGAADFARTVAERVPFCELHPWNPEGALEDANRDGRLLSLQPR